LGQEEELDGDWNETEGDQDAEDRTMVRMVRMAVLWGTRRIKGLRNNKESYGN